MEKRLDDKMLSAEVPLIFIEKFKGDPDFKMLIDQLSKVSEAIHKHALQYNWEDPRNKEIMGIVQAMTTLKIKLKIQHDAFKITFP